MLQQIIRLIRCSRYAWYALLVFLANAQQLLAQVAEEEPKSKNYTVVYIIMIACVGVSLSLMLRSGKRTTDFRNPGAKA